MIAKSVWFNRRKYSGWGLVPKKWQGVNYILVVAGAIAFVQSLNLNGTLKLILTAALSIFALADLLQAMAGIELDEREQKIEAIAERNASWTMVTASAFSILYIATLGKELKGTDLVPYLVFPILIGVIAKGLSNYILERRGV